MDERLHDLLDIWEDQREQGVVLSAEDLCALRAEWFHEAPGLRDELTTAMRQLQAFRRNILDPTPSWHGPQGPEEALPAIENYRVQRLAGVGGMGRVYLAQDEQLGLTVAIKILDTSRGLLLEGDRLRLAKRFVQEARTLAALSHPHIVRVFAGKPKDDRPYFAMEYLPRSLAEPAERARLRQAGPRATAEFMVKVAQAVHYAHEHDVLHRDLKPSNILLDGQGEPKVCDFGLAKLVQDADEGAHASPVNQTIEGRIDETAGPLTRTGHQPGTPAFMAPEQHDPSRGPIDARTDLWALGVIFYELLTGRKPFPGEDRATLQQEVLLPPLSPRLLRKDLPRDLEMICLKCLRTQPAQRYDSALELAQELRRYLNGEPVKARHIGVPARGWHWTRRHPATALALVSVLMLLTVVPSSLVWHTLRLDQAQEMARSQELYRLIFEVKERRLRHPPGWTWDNLRDLEDAARLRPAAGQVPLLRSEAAAALAGVDVRPARSVARGFLAHEAAFSPDGKWLALAQGIGDSPEPMRVLLIDPADGRTLRELPFPSYHDEWQEVAKRAEASRSLAFSPDGRWLVLGTRSGHVHRWDMSQPEPPLTSEKAHDAAVDRLVFTAEPQRLYSLDGKGRLLSWKIRASWERTAPPELQGLEGMAALPSTNLVATQASSWVGIRDGETFGSLEGWRNPDFKLLVAAPDGLSLLSSNYEKGLELRKASHGALLAQLPDSGGSGMCAFSTHGTLLAKVSGGTRRLNMWDLASGQLAVSAAVPRALNSVAIDLAARMVAVPAEDQTYLYELRRSAVHQIMGIQPETVVNLALGQDGISVWTVAPIRPWAHEIGELREWPVGTSMAVQQVASTGCFLVAQGQNTNAARPYPTAVHPKRDLVACATQDKLHFHDRLGRAHFAVAGVSCVNDLCFDPGGTLWIADHHAVRKSHARPGSLATVWQNSAADQGAGLTLISIAAGKTTVVVGRRDGMLLHFEQDELRGTQTICASPVRSLALSADNRLVLAGTELGKVCLVALPSGEVIRRFSDHADAVTGVAFAGPDLLVSGSRDGTIRLWRLDGTLLLTLDLPGKVQRLESSADGTRLAVLVEGERAVRIFHLDRLSGALADLGLPLDVPALRHPPPRGTTPPPLAPAYPIQPPTGPNGLKTEYFVTPCFQLKSFESYCPNIHNIHNSRGNGWPTQFERIRWTGWLKAPEPGQYWLWVAHENPVWVWVDGHCLPDTRGLARGFNGGAALLGDHPVRLRIDLRGDSSSRCNLFWQKQPGGPAEIIPAEALFHEEAAAARAVVPPRAAFAVPPHAERAKGPNGLNAQFYLGNLFQVLWKERYDDQVNFGLGADSFPAGLANDFFSVRWSGWLQVPRTGRYLLDLEHSFSVELFLDNQRVPHKPKARIGSEEIEVDLEADRVYPLRIEYRHGQAPPNPRCTFRWRRPGSTSLEVVPKSALLIDRPQKE